MAQDHPDSQFVGIDASSRQIAEGWKTVEQLGLKNLQLKHLDVLDVAEELGQFDYIISHGVFSWVPARVQNKMLEICQRQLAPNGVGYISYNTYPGWHIRGIVRDMMFYRGAQFADPAARLAQAKALVQFVAQATKGADTPYQRLLQSELKHMGQMEDYYLHHEHLEENNQPLYFHEFARKLSVNGLQYLGDAEFSTMVSSNFSGEVAKTLHELGAHDIIQMEQYMDFVRCRYFRKSLICRTGVQLNRTVTPAVVRDLLLSSDAAPVAAKKASPGEAPVDTETFHTASGYSVNCRSPLTKAALRELHAKWPMPVAFKDLVAHCGGGREGRGVPGRRDADVHGGGRGRVAAYAGAVHHRGRQDPGHDPARAPRGAARLQDHQPARREHRAGRAAPPDRAPAGRQARPRAGHRGADGVARAWRPRAATRQRQVQGDRGRRDAQAARPGAAEGARQPREQGPARAPRCLSAP